MKIGHENWLHVGAQICLRHWSEGKERLAL
jgi:hypothetical protein